MITNYEATVVTTDDIVHEVNLEGQRIGYVIKTENKETPFTVVDIDGPSGNVKTLDEVCHKNVPGSHRKESARRKKKPDFWQL